MKRLRPSTAKEPSSSSKKYKREIDDDLDHEEDRISQLPEQVLFNIRSLLPIEDAIKTSVLSKTWNYVSNSFPIFNFDQKYFNESKDHEAIYKDFANYVNKTITRRRSRTNIISIEKFKLAVHVKHTRPKSREKKDLDRWLHYAVSNNVEHLILHYLNWTTSAPYVLPMSSLLFRANNNKWLKELDLYGCKFVDNLGIGQIGLSLKKLTLERVDIDDQTLQSLLSTCSSSLEELSIRSCDGFQSVNISSTTLESVNLLLSEFQVQKVAVEAPNLRFLCYEESSKNAQASFEASNFNKNLVKELRFNFVVISDAIIQLIVREFLVLEKLVLYWCVLEENIRISSSNRLLDLDMTNRLKNVDQLITNCSIAFSCHDHEIRETVAHRNIWASILHYCRTS